jgi:hypothetical protein
VQQAHRDKVRLATFEQPKEAGLFDISLGDAIVYALAFNNENSESSLQFINIKERIADKKNLTYSESVATTLERIEQKNKVTWLWKWFLALAIVSLIFEILILKFFKP